MTATLLLPLTLTPLVVLMRPESGVRTDLLPAAVLSGNRNMGLLLVITAGTAGEVFSLYVAIAQIPMYFAPLLLSPLLRPGRA